MDYIKNIKNIGALDCGRFDEIKCDIGTTKKHKRLK